MKRAIAIIASAVALIFATCLVGCAHKHDYKRVDYVYAVYRVADTDTDNFDSKLESTRTSLRALLVSKGYSEAIAVIENGDSIRVEIPNVNDASDILSIIGEPVQISFVLTQTGETVLTGDDVVKASVLYNANDGYVVSLELTAEGQEKFFEATSEHINETMDIVVTIVGESTTISSPTINSAVSGNAIISGNFTERSAQQLADQIIGGTFEVELVLFESDAVSYYECRECGARKLSIYDIL